MAAFMHQTGAILTTTIMHIKLGTFIIMHILMKLFEINSIMKQVSCKDI